MSSSSSKQANFMAAAAHNPQFAAKVGVKPDVAKDFNQADKGKGIIGKGKKKKAGKKFPSKGKGGFPYGR